MPYISEAIDEGLQSRESKSPEMIGRVWQSRLLFAALGLMVFPGEVYPMDHLLAKFGGKPCEVFFFKSWSTYSHPVKPTGPMEFEEAIMRDGYYRAWLCSSDSRKLFVYFEGIEMTKRVTDIRKSAGDGDKTRLFQPAYKANQLVAGRELTGNETIKVDSFLASLPNKSDYLVFIEQKSVISYEYQYNENGKLVKVLVRDFEGNIKTIDY